MATVTRTAMSVDCNIITTHCFAVYYIQFLFANSTLF